MTVVAHLSDPHFGSESPAVAAALVDDLFGRAAPAPSLVIVSGDLTQRAKVHQFRAARAFLDRLPAPYLVVPGNHDIPLYDVWSRFLHPLDRYRANITEDLLPHVVADGLVVVGVNTAHGFTFKDGKVTVEQARAAAEVFAAHPDRFKILVAHHPFVLPAGRPARERVDGAEHALPILHDAGVEVICSGHLHAAHASDTGGFRDARREILAVHAGTCISTRTRGEPNGYNRLVLDGDRFTVHHRVWDGDRFTESSHKAYRRERGRWLHDPDVVAA
ncbi:MAG: metallophosphoesterase [Deltaproteobacteria bacterium]|nr:metallophosphoesterase [Kofleriaceae bacterium]